jgi:copper homeostasis protein
MKRTEFEIEICANSVESCLAAQEGGADRVELCMGIPEGGTTPSYGEIKVSRQMLTTTRLHVIIRNRGGDFLYTPLELERMTADIDICKQLGADGVVFGCLTADGGIDQKANAMLMEHAKGMSVTFHRAFDRCKDPQKALEDIISLGFNRILTSGQQPSAKEGIPFLKKLQQQAGDRIKIMAGCGVNEGNIAQIQKETGVMNFHFSAREPQKSQMKYFNPDVFMGAKGADEDTIMLTTECRVRNTIHALLDE